MKTEELVSLLAARVEPIDPSLTARRYRLALTGGLIGALVLCCGLLGLNPRLSHETAQPMFWIREAYCSALAFLGLVAVTRLARPGLRMGFVTTALGCVLCLMWALAAHDMLTAPAGQHARLIFGSTAAVCPFLIAMVSAPLFVGYMWMLRSLAATHLSCAGAAGGFAAGSLGALVYSLHCPELAPPFIGIWYLLGISIPTAIGTAFGPRLLRW